jgi:hypothetical protein
MRTLAPEQLPPYGFMWKDWQEGAEKNAPPGDWKGGARKWKQWFSATLGLLRDNVWPVYAPGGWKGGARDHMVAITRVDLMLIADFQRKYLDAEAGGFGGITHRAFFDDEDYNCTYNWEKPIAQYCAGLSGSTADFLSILEHAMKDKLSLFLAEQFKRHLQRPRPFQTSMLLGMGPYTYYWAKTAVTPSAISGHAVQAGMMGCYAYHRLFRYDEELAARYRKHLQQWATDCGDRRVMAGVHYPSDNVASWIVLLRLVDHVYDDRRVRPFAAEAIRNSLLYRFLDDRIRTDRAVRDAYAKPWSCLRAALKPS